MNFRSCLLGSVYCLFAVAIPITAHSQENKLSGFGARSLAGRLKGAKYVGLSYPETNPSTGRPYYDELQILTVYSKEYWEYQVARVEAQRVARNKAYADEKTWDAKLRAAQEAGASKEEIEAIRKEKPPRFNGISWREGYYEVMEIGQDFIELSFEGKASSTDIIPFARLRLIEWDTKREPPKDQKE